MPLNHQIELEAQPPIETQKQDEIFEGKKYVDIEDI